MPKNLRKSLDRYAGKWSVTTGEQDTGRFAGLFDTEDDALYFVYLVCDLEGPDAEFEKMIRDVKWVCGYGSYRSSDLTYWVEEVSEDSFYDELCNKDAFEDFLEVLNSVKKPIPKGKIGGVRKEPKEKTPSTKN